MNVNIMFMLNKQIWRKDFHVTTDQIFLFHIIVGQSKRDPTYHLSCIEVKGDGKDIHCSGQNAALFVDLL